MRRLKNAFPRLMIDTLADQIAHKFQSIDKITFARTICPINLLCEIAKDRIVILSTHIVGDIEATCENIAVLNLGEILFRGTVSELLQAVRGKVYTLEVSTLELPMMQEKFLVTGILTNGSTANIKLIADQAPMREAKQAEPDVEDAYMYLMNHTSASKGRE